MSLLTVRAMFECDGCATQFKVEMDPDEAVDYLRGVGSASAARQPGALMIRVRSPWHARRNCNEGSLHTHSA